MALAANGRGPKTALNANRSIMKKYRLIDLAKGKLRVEDKCQALRLAVDCDDMLMTIRRVYEIAGR